MSNPATTFFDLCSGGSQKEDYGLIIIELPLEEAIDYFIDRFGHDPHYVTCDCCGSDYSVSEHSSLERAKNLYDDFWKPYVILKEEIN